MSAEAAVIDPPTTTPAPTSHGRISFKDALAKAEAEAAPHTPQPTPEPKPAAADKEPPKEQAKEKPAKVEKPAAKPANALDALLAAKPAAEPKAETEPETTDDPLKDFPADAKDKDRNYAGLRKKAEDGWARARELEKKQSTPDPKLTGELETLRKTLTERETALQEREAKLAEYKDAMVAVNIELDPDYRKEFIDGRKQQVFGAASKLKAYGGDDGAFVEAMTLPEGRRRDEAVEALTETLGDSAKAKIMRAVTDIEALDERRAAVLANSQEKWEELQMRHAAQARAQAKEEEAQAQQSEVVLKSMFDKIARELAADESLEGGKEWNAGRAANLPAALELLRTDAPPEKVITASIKAADYDRVFGLLVEKNARLAEYESAQPTTSGRKTPAPTKEEELAKLTPGQRFAAQMGSGKNEDF